MKKVLLRWKHFYSLPIKRRGKSFSEALILASVNPQYDESLFIECQGKFKFTTCCVQILFLMSKQKQKNNTCTHTMSWGCWKHHFGIPGIRPIFLKPEWPKESKNGFKTIHFRPYRIVIFSNYFFRYQKSSKKLDGFTYN